MISKREKELTLSGRFYRMRDEWIRHVLRIDKEFYTHTEKLVAIYIAETINPQDRSWIVSQDRIAKDLDVKIRVVKNAVAKLKKDGLVIAVRVPVAGHTKLFNSYSLVSVQDARPL